MKWMRLSMITIAVAAMAMLAAPSSQAQAYKVLYSFTGGADGGYPGAGVIQDAKGNLYGTTENGGNTSCAGGCGTIFTLSKAGHETVLYSFAGGADGSFPSGGVIRDRQANLYGTTENGVPNNAGTVFQLSKSGKETALYSFTGGADGSNSTAGVIQDAKGNLYGTTQVGGATNNGTVFKLSKTGKETVLYSFCSVSQCTDGGNPHKGVIQDANGTLFGTTLLGGDPCDCGVVYKLSIAGKEVVLHTFTGGADGANPNSGVIQDAHGNLYGTTYYGGAYNSGTLFKLSKSGKETVLYSFTGGADGSSPSGGLIRDAKGNVFGTTEAGGAYGYGTVFKVSRRNKETVLYSFTGKAGDGATPTAGVIQDAQGNLYGTTYSGAYGYGTVFKLTPSI